MLGILGLVAVPFLPPFAWYLGSQALAEIDAAPGVYGNRDHATIGRILGIVGTILLGVILLLILVTVGFLVLGMGVMASTL